MKDGGPAFPLECNVESLADEEGQHRAFAVGHLQQHAGMSLRDYFAAKAMQSLVVNSIWTDLVSKDAVAGAAYEMADAMLAEREKQS